MLLDQEGYANATAANGVQAIVELEAGGFDLVVTDLHMPGRGGVGLTAALRADPRTRSIPIIVVTGLGGAKDWEILRRLGADRFLVKPLDLDELVTSIRALVDRSRRPRG